MENDEETKEEDRRKREHRHDDLERDRGDEEGVEGGMVEQERNRNTRNGGSETTRRRIERNGREPRTADVGTSVSELWDAKRGIEVPVVPRG